ncbi:MAG: tetrahydromethanopterin S-methyltransferase subunit H [Thermoleophilia bacterium]
MQEATSGHLAVAQGWRPPVPEVEVAGVRMGGPPGMYPTVLVGSIFYDRHKIVADMKTGVFDEETAERLLREQDAWSARTGNPCMVDVVASSKKAMVRYLDFVLSRTAAPVMVDGSSPEVRMAGVKWAAGEGVIDRVIYNSLSPESTSAEYDVLGECGCRSAVLLSVASDDLSLAGRLNALEGERGLLARAKAAGVDRLLVDPGVIDIPSLGIAAEAMHRIRTIHGLVCGTAAHNALGTWGGLWSGKFGDDAPDVMSAVVSALNTAWAGSFLIYGPLSAARRVFPAVAAVDAAQAQILMEEGVMVDLEHPLFKIA